MLWWWPEAEKEKCTQGVAHDVLAELEKVRRTQYLVDEDSTKHNKAMPRGFYVVLSSTL